jgi:hypothetical protein
VIDKYDLTEMGARLESAWTGETGERTSLRDLATMFNEAVLTAALREAGSGSLAVEVAGTYETLSSGSDADATRVRRGLEREGVDPDDIESDFVTHQAIHTYLKRDRDASLPADDRDRRERKIESIKKLQGRLTAVTETALSALAATDELDRDDYDVLVNVRAVCPDCGADQPISELLQESGCSCVNP